MSGGLTIYYNMVSLLQLGHHNSTAPSSTQDQEINIYNYGIVGVSRQICSNDKIWKSNTLLPPGLCYITEYTTTYRLA